MSDDQCDPLSEQAQRLYADLMATSEQPTMGVYQRNADGSWTTAVPLGWQGPDNQVDFEVTRGVGHWLGDGWCRDRKVTQTLVARTRVGFIFTARRHVGWRTPVTFLWDQK